jgi:hypothetical protein
MTKRHRAMRFGACLVAALAVLLAPLGATDIFRARMLTGKAPIEPPVVSIQIEVESWTTPEEIRQLQDVMQQSGIQPFLSAFSAIKKGVVRFMYARGWNLPIHMAQVLPTEEGKRILIFLDREAWVQGSYLVRGRNYFMIIELNLNEKGRGEGRFYEDAQIQLDSALGKIEIANYESAPKIFVQVQEVVKKAKTKKK